jgi:hypothetical protein
MTMKLSETDVYAVTAAATIASMCHDYLGHGITTETFINNIRIAAKWLSDKAEKERKK